MKKDNILVIVSHPDDEILGCGATMARLSKEGHKVYTLILGEGLTSRDQSRDAFKHAKGLKELKTHIAKSNKIVGVKEFFTADLPDNRFDSVDLLDVVKEVEYICKKIKPKTIFTHSRHDLNIDHRVTYQAVLTATRPMVGQVVKNIYSCEVLSSTEWNYPLNFTPNYFVDVSKTIEKKVKAMAEYKTELRKYPHPRSLKGIRLSAENWGMKVGVPYAEAFEVIRAVA